MSLAWQDEHEYHNHQTECDWDSEHPTPVPFLDTASFDVEREREFQQHVLEACRAATPNPTYTAVWACLTVGLTAFAVVCWWVVR